MMAAEYTDPDGSIVPQAGCGFVEVLTRTSDACVFGYRIGGARPGPTVVVAGYAPVAPDIYDRLLKLPTLPWMRGTLVLVTLDTLDAALIEEELVGQIGPVERTIHLPYPDRRDSEPEIRRGYWTVLKACARLGMISGRGVAADGGRED